MANTFAPFGFQHVERVDGAAPNFAQTWVKVSKSNSTPIYFGDPVTQLATGYVTQSTAGTTQIKGICYECKYLQSSPGAWTWTRGWGGSNAAIDPDIAICMDPGALFEVQANGLVTLSHIGQNANFGLGTGSTLTGFSGAFLDVATIATTNTLPFRIVGFSQRAVGAPGGDSTSAFNVVQVTFNNQDMKSLTGI